MSDCAEGCDPCPLIIGICGDIGSGKDAVAEALYHGLGYVRAAFADHLKTVVAEAFPWIPTYHFFGTQAEKAATLFVHNGRVWTGRKLLEELGEAFRQVFPDVWLKAVMDRIDASDPWRWVIPDVRHPNEFQAIRNRGGVVWEVVKTGGPPAKKTSHLSDNAWRAIQKDATLVAAYGDLGGLQQSAKRLALAGGKV